jgi:DNA-binding transcriptional ArsR family regulator
MVKFHETLDRTFAALSDPTRRDILDRLATRPASVSDLARSYRMSLPGVLKHVRVLEEADLVTTVKRGRVRECRLGPRGLDDATQWMERHRRQWNRRLDRLEEIVQRRKRGSSN